MSDPSSPAASDPPRVAAFFDVDNTILRGASIFHLGIALYRRGLLSVRDCLRMIRLNTRYVLFGESVSGVEATSSGSLETIRHQPAAQMAAVAEEVWDKVLAGRVYPGTQALLDQHLAEGDEVWLVSASPAQVVELIGQRVGATGTLGTEVEIKNGYFTGRLTNGLMHGPAKAEAVEALAKRRSLNLAKSFAYGDSANDIPMLRLVGNPCAINPDRRLRRYCRDQRWPMREFRDKRRAARRSLRAVSRIGGLWAAWIVFRRIFVTRR
jgi:HAD superfamily hydrolase (TIGR01490 family)